jgi:hypothetical protein
VNRKALYYIAAALSIAVLASSCLHKQPDNNSETILTQKIDSLRQELHSFKNEIRDSTKRTDKVTSTILNKDTARITYHPLQTKTSPYSLDSINKKAPAKTVIQPAKPDTATIVHYFKDSKRPSVKITPWHEGKRSIILFDTTETETYRFDDVRMSYSSTSDLKSFHENGAVKHIHNHMNPGASMYWYDSDIYFDTNNEPTEKTDLRQPAKLEDYMNSKSVWNKATRSWEKLN